MAALPVLPVVVLIGSALLVLAIGAHVHRRVVELLALAASLSATVLCAVLLVRANDTHLHWFGGWRPNGSPPIGVDFAVDRMGAGLGLLSVGLVAVAVIVSWKYFDEVEPRYYAVMLVFAAAALGLCFTGDLFNLFVFFELVSVAGYVLAAYKIEDEGALQGGLNFAVATSIGAFAMLAGIALLYGRTSSLSLAEVGRRVAMRPADALVIAALTLVGGGLFVKAAVVPFHFWLADAHAIAPTPVCVLFSGMMVELGIYAFARVYWTVFSGAVSASSARPVLLAAGTLTAVLGAVLCLAQHHLKRLLAYSTISHAGIMIAGIGVLDAKATAGAGVYVLGHGCVKGALFLCTAVLVYRFGAMDEHRLRGRARKLYIVGPCWFVGGLALAGLPPFAPYLGKGFIDESLAERHLVWLAVLLTACAAATGGAVLRAGGRVFFGIGGNDDDESAEREGDEESSETARDRARTSPLMLLPIPFLLLVALALGLAPGLGRHASDAATRFVDRPAYEKTVLEGRSTAPSPEPLEPTTSGVLAGIAAAVAAVAIAGAQLLTREPRPGRVRAATTAAYAPVRALKALHTGRVGDLVSWLVFGLAAFGGAIALAVRWR